MGTVSNICMRAVRMTAFSAAFSARGLFGMRAFLLPSRGDVNAPARSVEQPAATVLMELISAYEEHKTTEQYQEAVRNSQKQQERQKRLSHELWWAQYHYTKGCFLATKVKDGMLKFGDLDSKEQELVEATALGRLLQQKRSPRRGVGPEVDRQR